MNSFYIVFFLALLPSIYLSYRTKELPFFLPDLKTDNEKMLIAASKIKIFSWPSKIHSIENIGEQSRSQSREYWTIMCAVFQKIFRTGSQIRTLPNSRFETAWGRDPNCGVIGISARSIYFSSRAIVPRLGLVAPVDCFGVELQVCHSTFSLWPTLSAAEIKTHGRISCVL